MRQNYSQLIIGIIIGLVLGVLIGKQYFVQSPSPQPPASPTASSPNIQQKENQAPSQNGQLTSIPQKAYEVLRYIRANKRAMDGYVGGRAFSNREKIVPQADNNGNPIHYQEWDVNPKTPGVNRGTERILTGSDGRAWYTNDHYQSFKEIK